MKITKKMACLENPRIHQILGFNWGAVKLAHLLLITLPEHEQLFEHLFKNIKVMESEIHVMGTRDTEC